MLTNNSTRKQSIFFIFYFKHSSVCCCSLSNCSIPFSLCTVFFCESLFQSQNVQKFSPTFFFQLQYVISNKRRGKKNVMYIKMFGILHTIFFLLFFNRSHPQARSTLRRLALVSRSVFNIIYRKGTEHKKMKNKAYYNVIHIFTEERSWLLTESRASRSQKYELNRIINERVNIFLWLFSFDSIKFHSTHSVWKNHRKR